MEGTAGKPSAERPGREDGIVFANVIGNPDGDVVLTPSRNKLAMLLKYGAKHEDCAALVAKLAAYTANTAAVGRVNIIDFDDITAYGELLSRVTNHHPELSTQCEDALNDKDAWGDRSKPFGWPTIEGPYAAIQRYTTWKQAYDGQATYDEWKEYVEPYRGKRYKQDEASQAQPRDTAEAGGHCAAGVVVQHKPPFPIGKEEVEQSTENPTQLVAVRVKWIRNMLLNASLEDEETLGLDLEDLEERLVPDIPGILVGDKEVHITLAQKQELLALEKAVQWLRDNEIVKGPGYLPEHEENYKCLVEAGKMKDTLNAYAGAVEAERSAPPTDNTWLQARYPAACDAAAAEVLNKEPSANQEDDDATEV